MDIFQLKPEREAQLKEYAERHGKNPADALDEALATYLEWEREDFESAAKGVNKAFEDIEAGRTRPAKEFFEEMREKYGFSR